jgi:hypothetical protein
VFTKNVRAAGITRQMLDPIQTILTYAVAALAIWVVPVNFVSMHKYEPDFTPSKLKQMVCTASSWGINC